MSTQNNIMSNAIKLLRQLLREFAAEFNEDTIPPRKDLSDYNRGRLDGLEASLTVLENA